MPARVKALRLINGAEVEDTGRPRSQTLLAIICSFIVAGPLALVVTVPFWVRRESAFAEWIVSASARVKPRLPISDETPHPGSDWANCDPRNSRVSVCRIPNGGRSHSLAFKQIFHHPQQRVASIILRHVCVRARGLNFLEGLLRVVHGKNHNLRLWPIV